MFYRQESSSVTVPSPFILTPHSHMGNAAWRVTPSMADLESCLIPDPSPNPGWIPIPLYHMLLGPCEQPLTPRLPSLPTPRPDCQYKDSILAELLWLLCLVSIFQDYVPLHLCPAWHRHISARMDDPNVGCSLCGHPETSQKKYCPCQPGCASEVLPSTAKFSLKMRSWLLVRCLSVKNSLWPLKWFVGIC